MTEKQRQETLQKLERLEQANNIFHDGQSYHPAKEADEFESALEDVIKMCKERVREEKALDDGWGY